MQSPAGKIHQQVDASGLAENLGKNIFDRRRVGQLNRAIFGLASLLAQLFQGLGSALLIFVENENRIAGFDPNGELPHDRCRPLPRSQPQFLSPYLLFGGTIPIPLGLNDASLRD